MSDNPTSILSYEAYYTSLAYLFILSFNFILDL